MFKTSVPSSLTMYIVEVFRKPLPTSPSFPNVTKKIHLYTKCSKFRAKKFKIVNKINIWGVLSFDWMRQIRYSWKRQPQQEFTFIGSYLFLLSMFCNAVRTHWYKYNTARLNALICFAMFTSISLIKRLYKVQQMSGYHDVILILYVMSF